MATAQLSVAYFLKECAVSVFLLMVCRIKSITPQQRKFMAQKWRLELFFDLPFKIISVLKQMHMYIVSLARNSENKLHMQSVHVNCKKCLSILDSASHVSVLLWKK